MADVSKIKLRSESANPLTRQEADDNFDELRKLAKTRSVLFRDIDDLTSGVCIDRDDVLTSAEIQDLYTKGIHVSTTEFASGSGLGASEYKLITKAQADTDGITYWTSGSKVGFYAFLLSDGLHVAVGITADKIALSGNAVFTDTTQFATGTTKDGVLSDSTLLALVGTTTKCRTEGFHAGTTVGEAPYKFLNGADSAAAGYVDGISRFQIRSLDVYTCIDKGSGIIKAEQVGCIGDNVTNNQTYIDAASSIFDVCIFAKKDAVYRFTTTPTLSANFTSVFINRSSLTGKSPSQLKAIFLDGGSLNGYAISPEMDNEKVHIIAGTLRQNSGDRTQWDWIKDANHEPLGVDDSSPATASGSSLTVPFDRTFTQVGGLVCGGDETLSNALGLSVGASVGLTNFEIKANVKLTLSAHIRYDGSNWQVVYGQGQGGAGNHNVNVTGMIFSGGNLTINHEWIPGTALSVTNHSNNGAVVPSYLPCIKSQSPTQTVINFVNSGSFVTTADTKMSIQFVKNFNAGIAMDGTDNGDVLDLNLGNIWFVGFMIE